MILELTGNNNSYLVRTVLFVRTDLHREQNNKIVVEEAIVILTICSCVVAASWSLQIWGGKELLL